MFCWVYNSCARVFAGLRVFCFVVNAQRGEAEAKPLAETGVQVRSWVRNRYATVWLWAAARGQDVQAGVDQLLVAPRNL